MKRLIILGILLLILSESKSFLIDLNTDFLIDKVIIFAIAIVLIVALLILVKRFVKENFF